MQLEGVDPGLRIGFRKLKGLPSLLDAMQYSPLPLGTNALSASSGIPMATVSRSISKLVKLGVRVRVDYNLNDLDLKLVVMEVDSMWRPGEGDLPLKHWISSAFNTLNGTFFLAYRVPREMSLAEVTKIVQARLGDERRILYAEEYRNTMMAKPSFQYYMKVTGGNINPKVALKVAQDHPRNEYNRLDTLLKPRRPPGFRVTKDMIDLIILSLAEVDSLTLKRRLYRLLHLQAHKEYRVKAEKHIAHTNKIVRGNRVMASDKKNNLFMGIGVQGDEKCVEEMTTMMLAYFYAYSIAYDKGKAFYVISMPHSYVHDLIMSLDNLCNLDPPVKPKFKLIPFSLNGFVARMSVPYRNYDFLKKSWVTDERILDMMSERIRKKYPVDLL